MDDATLRGVLLVKAIEASDPEGRTLPLPDRDAATREALREAGAGGRDPAAGPALDSPEALEDFLAARTRRLLPPLSERLPALATVATSSGWPWWLSALALLAAFASGFGLSALGGAKKVDILAVPFLGIVLWNLIAYAGLAVHAVWGGARAGARRRPHRSTGNVAWHRGLAHWLGRLAVHAPGGAAALPAGALARFARDVGEAAAERLAADARRLLHLAAAALAVGLVTGIYLRGTVLQYLAGWESTFLDAAQVRSLIGLLFAPAAAVSGLPLPASIAEVEALNWARGGVPAAPWLHLIALTLLLYVVVPRLVLALGARLHSLRLARGTALAPPLLDYARALAGGAAAGAARTASPSTTVDLSLISHTNVGKTTLARTLLHRDVGEVRDAEHVTTQASAYELVFTDAGDLLQLWDTPGFARSERLAARLEQGGALGWFLSQVWDRLTDQDFFLSQRALANVREQADLVLYLVDSRTEPDRMADLDAEMRILGWLDKPVIVLLNQLGEPQAAERERAEVERWATRLGRYPWVRDTLPFDAFARCWVQERTLVDRIGAALPGALSAPWSRIAAAWNGRNERVFAESARALAGYLAAVAVDVEDVSARGIAATARDWMGRLAGGAEASGRIGVAMQALARRASASLGDATRRLLDLHGLNGSVAEEIDARVAAHFSVQNATDPGKAGLLGAVLSGALGGLAADLASGGLTMGAGALIGALAGAAGGTGIARAFNLMRGTERSSVRWSPDLLMDLTAAAAQRYLAVAHFGRGRGDYVASESPPHWDGVVQAAVARQRDAWLDAWAMAGRGEPAAAVGARLHPLFAALLRGILEDLYPATATAHRGDAGPVR